MKFVGFVFNKISAEKMKEFAEGMKFNTKINFLSIESVKSNFLKIKEEIIKVNFSYTVSYDPDFAKIELAGDILISVEPKEAKNILTGWKEKKMSEDFRMPMFNLILRKSNIKALQLEEELGLMPHIPLPYLDKDSFKENKTTN